MRILKQLVRLVHPTQHPPLQRRPPPLAFCRNGNPTGGGPLMLLERFAIARDDSQSSTRQGNSGGAVPSADFAIIVGDLL